MKNIKKKNIFIMLLVVILFLAATGYSAWVITNVKDIDNPVEYNYRELVTRVFTDQTKEYTGKPLQPDATFDGDLKLFDSSTYKFVSYSLNDGTPEWREGTPTDAGEYLLRIQNMNDLAAEPIEVKFTISASDVIYGYNFSDQIKSIGIGGEYTPSLTPNSLPTGITVDYYIKDGENETLLSTVSTDVANNYTIVAKFTNTSNPNYTDSGYLVSSDNGLITMQLSVVDKVIVNIYGLNDNLLKTEYISYGGTIANPGTVSDDYMYSYYWMEDINDSEITDFSTFYITESVNIKLSRKFREYSVSVLYVDRDNVATKAGYAFATNITSNYNNETISYSSDITGLNKEMKLVLSDGKYYYYYLSSISSFGSSDWSRISELSNNSYKVYQNYTLVLQNETELTIIVHCVQAQAIVHTGALTETSTTIGDPLGTYYASAKEAFLACQDVATKTYLRVFGIARWNKPTGNCYLPTENPSIASYKLTIYSETDKQIAITYGAYSIDLSNYTIDFDYNINSYLNVILPYGREDTSTTGYLLKQTANSAGSANAIHSFLIFAEGIEVNVDGTLTVGGVVKSGGVVASHAVLMNDAYITMNAGTNIYSYGYIRGNGEVNLLSGSSIHDVYKIFDWKGGANSMGVSGAGITSDADYFPFNCYASHNTSCKVTINYGANYYAYNQLYMADSWACVDDLLLVGDGGLFELTDTNGYLIRTIEETTLDLDVNNSYTAFSYADDSNSAKEITIRDVYTIYGAFIDNPISVTIKVLLSKTITSGPNLPLPLGLIKLNIMSGNSKLTSNSFRCLPGSYIYIAEGATVEITSGIKIMIYENFLDDYEHTDEGGNVHKPCSYAYSVKHAKWYESGRDDIGAQVIIDGKLICNGSIGGTIKSNGHGIFITKNNSVSLIEIATLKYAKTGGSKTQSTQTYSIKGTINFEDNQLFATNKNYYYYDNSWHLDTGTISYNNNYGSNDTISSKSVTYYDGVNIGYVITSNDLTVTPTRQYYEFKGWYLDPECSVSKEALNKEIYYSTVLYAKWEPINYKITYDADKFVGCESDGLTYDTTTFVNSYNYESNIILPNNLERTGYKFDGWYTDLDFTNKITVINKDTISQIGNITLYGLWVDDTSTTIDFIYISNSPIDGINDSIVQVVRTRVDTYILLDYNSNSIVSASDNYFLGWYVDESLTTEYNSSIHITGETTEITLYAKWTKKYNVTLYNGNEIYDSFVVLLGDKLETLPTLSVEHKTFKGWFKDAELTTQWNSSSDSVSADMNLYAKFEDIYFTVTFNANGGSVSPSSAQVKSGESLILPSPSYSGYSLNGWYTSSSGDTKVGTAGDSYKPTNDITLYAQWAKNSGGGGCLAEGTLITMADGTKKKVEDILPGDLLIVFNHETGKYETAEVLFNDSELIDNYTIINLEFSNGSVVPVVYEHGFFDLDLMKYVYIDEYNYMDYVGHRFVASTYVDGEVVQSIVTLDNVFLTEEYIRIYSPVTKYHMNYMTEDILSMPGGIEGLFNIFEYDDNLQYNEEQMQKDIETYGLFTYEDFKDLVSYEVYCSFPAAYFKVALGKGILTWEDLEYYIARYAPLV